MATISDEKVSSDIESNVLIKEKIITDSEVEDPKNEVKSDAVLDEIAAKVNALDFNKSEEGDHSQCLASMKKQSETINTLVHQLRLMFDEYQEISQERDYYEELNNALLRCLEITEGRLQLDAEESDKEEENIRNLISKHSENKCTAQEDISDGETEIKTVKNENAMEKETIDEVPVETEESQADTLEEEEEDEEEEANDSMETEPKQKKTINNSELIRLNRVLLCEIFDLRNQIDVMKENIREYLYSEEDDEESEYDTATDDDHVCEHCTTATAPQVTTEEYEQCEDDGLEKIKDESDTE